MLLSVRRIAAIAVAVLAFGFFHSVPAAAQATRTWISGVGDDANPCSRTAPCKTFQGAYNKTAAGGEINCLDPGGFGAVTIVKSISIICDQATAGVVVAGSNAIIVNSTTAYVVLDGLDLEGLGNAATTAGLNGVNILNAAAVHIRNTKIRGFRNGYGINFQPQNANSQLFVDNVALSENGSPSISTTGGIIINPAAGYTANATITNTRIVDNLNVGIRVDTSGIVGSTITAMIDNVTLSNNGAGILVKAPSGTGTVKFMLTNSVVSLNVGQGIIINGTPTSAAARVGNTTITANGTGIMVLGTAVLQSYGDNRLDGNGTDGAFSGTPISKK